MNAGTVDALALLRELLEADDLKVPEPAIAPAAGLKQAENCKCIGGANPLPDEDGDPVCWRCGRAAA
jgi:hypothetical protein